MPFLRRRRRPPSAARASVQPWQFHSDAGDAKDRTAVVADQPAGEPDQDRRQGREPRPLRHLPMAKVAVSRQMFQEILALITRLRAPPTQA
jgi:hypothetical protein